MVQSVDALVTFAGDTLSQVQFSIVILSVRLAGQ